LSRILQLLHVYSLDVVLAAMAMSAWVFFAHNAPLNGPLIFSLGFFVWAIYLFDHAFDAERLPSLGFRRKTHFKNRKRFWGLGAFALICAAGLYIPFMPLLSRTSGLFLAFTLFLILCYFGIGLLPPLKRLQGHKEFFLPPGYTFGVALPFVCSQNQQLPDALFLFGISLLVLQSILLLAKLDAQEDALENNSTCLQKQPTMQFSIVFGVCSALWLGIAVLVPKTDSKMFWVGLAPWTLQGLFFLKPHIFTGWKTRSAIEWSLCLPGLILALLKARIF
jgi:hypothetical protein